MRRVKWVICSVCGRKYKATDDGKPIKHYVAPKFVKRGEVTYLTNPGWEAKRETCPGVYEKGDPI